MMKDIFKKSFLDFKYSYDKYLSFEFVYSLFTSIMFAPLLAYIFNKFLILFRNNPSLINNEVFSFGFSFKGLISLFLIALLIVSILFVEFGVVIMIAHKNYFRQPIYVSEALKITIKKLPKLLGFGTFQLFFILLLFIPLVDSATFPTFLEVNVTIVLADLFDGSFVARVIYFMLFGLLILLFMRWVFALHFIFIKDETVWQAMKSSWQMTKYRKYRTVIYLVLVNVIIFLLGVSFLTLVSYLQGIIDSKVIGDFIGKYLMTFSSYLTIIMSLFLIPINFIILTRLFYKFSVDSGAEVKDQIVLTNSRLIKMEKSLGHLLSKRKSTLRLAIILVLSIMFMINYTTNEAITYLPWHIKVAAHRGDGFHSPENSMSGIHSAIEKGIDAIEIDVAMTKDGVMVLSHDDDLMRTAGIPDKIEDLTYNELLQVDIGKLFNADFVGEKIPTLAEVLAVVKETETQVIIDVKVDKYLEAYAEKIIYLIESYDVGDLSLVQSFNNDFLEIVRDLNEDIKIGQLLFLSVGNLSPLDVDFYNIRQTMLTERFIERAKKQNREVWVWTVNQTRHIKEVLKYDIDGIITDYPERVYQLLELN